MKKKGIGISKIYLIMLQRVTNNMANQVKTSIQNYFENVLYENLTFEFLPCGF